MEHQKPVILSAAANDQKYHCSLYAQDLAPGPTGRQHEQRSGIRSTR
jgi:hypothetical protein